MTQRLPAWMRILLMPVLAGTLSGQLQVKTELTFFTRAGWLFPWVAGNSALILLLIGHLRGKLRSTG